MRHATETGPDQTETLGLVAINLLILGAMLLPFPPGLIAVLGMAALIARRLARRLPETARPVLPA